MGGRKARLPLPAAGDTNFHQNAATALPTRTSPQPESATPSSEGPAPPPAVTFLPSEAPLPPPAGTFPPPESPPLPPVGTFPASESPPLPPWPIGPAIPSPILPGVERRLRDFVQWLRNLPGYEAAIGETLHIVGEEITLPDPASLQPTLKLRLNGGKVDILWGWGSAAKIAAALYLEVDRGTGPQFLASDTNPNYTDTFPLPSTPTKWKYRAIWMRDGQMIGQWSAWIEINVG